MRTLDCMSPISPLQMPAAGKAVSSRRRCDCFPRLFTSCFTWCFGEEMHKVFCNVQSWFCPKRCSLMMKILMLINTHQMLFLLAFSSQSQVHFSSALNSLSLLGSDCARANALFQIAAESTFSFPSGPQT